MDAAEIAQLRMTLGLSSLELAEALKVSQSLVLAWEAGRRFPTKRAVQAMRELSVETSRLPLSHDAASSSHQAELGRVVRILANSPERLEQISALLKDEADPGAREPR